ncbi:cache domain-containing protein [Photobacterium satsumensis]|uniref:cache domain-containing protein n=1 Tax=Photobacterium satsumensis TaxID=2910239 RepID=UPI003D0C9D10
MNKGMSLVNSGARVAVLAAAMSLSCGSVASSSSSLENASVENISTYTVSSPPIVTEAEKRARVLLDKAVRHIRQQGAESVDDFSHQQQFTDNELYVYALNVDGVFLASGGSSVVLVGDDVKTTADMNGKLFFRDMIEQATTSGEGVVEYHWTNPVDSAGEPKRTLFKREGDIIVAVGYHPARAAAYQAKGFLDQATKALINNEQDALGAFNRHDSQFVKNDLYVFVLDKRTGEFLAHGATPHLVGKVFNIQGKPMIGEMLKIAEETGRGEITYPWLNPTSGKVESKHTYYRILDNKLVGVGYYER